jgi:putative dimethyl sulfoxide reductase chaperone
MTAANTAARPEAAAMLSHWWSRPVQSEVAAWDDEWLLACRLAEDLGLEHREVADLAAARRSASAEDLLDEYERLFVGPGRTPCPPYESLWQESRPGPEQGRLMGAASTAVADLYRQLGLDVAAGAHDLPDHIAIELEALAYAAGRDGPEGDRVAEALLGEHLSTWLPGFCTAVEEESGVPFYAALARLTRSWVEALAGERPAGP